MNSAWKMKTESIGIKGYANNHKASFLAFCTLSALIYLWVLGDCMLGWFMMHSLYCRFWQIYKIGKWKSGNRKKGLCNNNQYEQRNTLVYVTIHTCSFGHDSNLYFKMYCLKLLVIAQWSRNETLIKWKARCVTRSTEFVFLVTFYSQ